MELKQQRIEFAKQVYGYNCGTGKDAKIFIKFIVNENGVKMCIRDRIYIVLKV